MSLLWAFWVNSFLFFNIWIWLEAEWIIWTLKAQTLRDSSFCGQERSGPLLVNADFWFPSSRNVHGTSFYLGSRVFIDDHQQIDGGFSIPNQSLVNYQPGTVTLHPLGALENTYEFCLNLESPFHSTNHLSFLSPRFYGMLARSVASPYQTPASKLFWRRFVRITHPV